MGAGRRRLAAAVVVIALVIGVSAWAADSWLRAASGVAASRPLVRLASTASATRIASHQVADAPAEPPQAATGGAEAVAALGSGPAGVAQSHGWTAAELTETLLSDSTLRVDARQSAVLRRAVDRCRTRGSMRRRSNPTAQEAAPYPAGRHLQAPQPSRRQAHDPDRLRAPHHDQQRLDRVQRPSEHADRLSGVVDRRRPRVQRRREDRDPGDLAARRRGLRAVQRGRHHRVHHRGRDHAKQLGRPGLRDARAGEPHRRHLHAAGASPTWGLRHVGRLLQACAGVPAAPGNNPKYIAEAVSHEVGHNLNLNHDGQGGTPSTTAAAARARPAGRPSWVSATTRTSRSGAGASTRIATTYRERPVDDPGVPRLSEPMTEVTRPRRRSPVSAGTTWSATGLVGSSSDVDVYRFTTGAGPVAIDVKPAATGPNLDVLAEIRNARAAWSPPANAAGGARSAGERRRVPAGTYYLPRPRDGQGRVRWTSAATPSYASASVAISVERSTAGTHAGTRAPTRSGTPPAPAAPSRGSPRRR